jgi:hypothetical protein
MEKLTHGNADALLKLRQAPARGLMGSDPAGRADETRRV